MDIVIRKIVQDDDYESLIKLSRRYFKEFEMYHDYFYKIKELSDAGIMSFFKRYIKGANCVLFVAEYKNTIVGYITAYIRIQEAYWYVQFVGIVSGLMVDPLYRENGIGQMLLENVETYMRDHNVDVLQLHVCEQNASAYHFYTKHGFTEIEETLIKGLIEK
jgi:ribosomal protein S18 acetylase RimI-like enzyme